MKFAVLEYHDYISQAKKTYGEKMIDKLKSLLPRSLICFALIEFKSTRFSLQHSIFFANFQIGTQTAGWKARWTARPAARGLRRSSFNERDKVP